MSSPLPGSPQQGTGLPPGVEVGPLGPRFVAYLIDAAVPAVLSVVLSLVQPNLSGVAATVITLVFVLAILAWVLVVWRGIATRAASPGMRVMKLQLVGFYDGRPVGWGRTIIRALLFGVVGGTFIGLIILLILLVLHPRKQGWHDLVAKAVVIKQRGLPPAQSASQPGIAAQSAPQQQPYAPAQYQPAQHEPAQHEPAQHDAGQQYAQEPYAQPYAPQPGPPQPYGEPQQPYAQPTPSYVEPAPAAYGAQPRYPHSPHSQPSAPPAAPPTPPPAQDSAPAPTPTQWLAELDDGREISIDGLVLLGRNPQPQPGEEDAQLIKLADETRTVSKSHLAIGLDAAGLFVVDRGSTNGSTVTTPEGVSTRCQPGEIIYVEEESIVSIGDHWLRIRTTSV